MISLSKVENFWLEDGVSKIEITGSHLEEFGFAIGTKVVIEITDKCIVIKPIDSEQKYFFWGGILKFSFKKVYYTTLNDAPFGKFYIRQMEWVFLLADLVLFLIIGCFMWIRYKLKG